MIPKNPKPPYEPFWDDPNYAAGDTIYEHDGPKAPHKMPELIKPFIGIDQFGNHYRLGAHPRKDLMNQLDRKSARKIYLDVGERTLHVGYIVACCWVDIYGLEGRTFATIAG